LLRLHGSYRLQASSSFQANYLHESLLTLNISVLNDVRQHSSNPDTVKHPDPSPDNALTTQLTDLLQYTGLDKPLDRVYVKLPALITNSLPYMILVVTLSVLPKLQYCSKLGSVVSVKVNEGIDGSAYGVGIVTLLRQTDESTIRRCFALFGQYMASVVNCVRWVESSVLNFFL